MAILTEDASPTLIIRTLLIERCFIYMDVDVHSFVGTLTVYPFKTNR